MLRRPSVRPDGAILSHDEVRRLIGDKRSYLLLGNSFSIACGPVFRYGSLYQVAVKAGLSRRAQLLFQRYGK